MRIHFIAIGGSIMHSLAIAMQQKGHQISGSDDEIYEPSRTRLSSRGLLPPEMGWHPDRITRDLDKVVLGMHARKDNPELQRALELGLALESFPEFMYSISRDKTRIVVAGSHGKTTTSGMIAYALDGNQIPADRMIGAIIGHLEPVSVSEAGIIVLEGDEYLSSPLDPRAKFLHYDPDIVIITGIAWDHMNVFPTHEMYMAPFRELISALRKEATLIYCEEDQQLVEMVQEIAPRCKGIPYNSVSYREANEETHVVDSDGKDYTMRIFGKHNMQNLAAAKLACAAVGLNEDAFFTAMQTFTGANKRLQVLYDQPGIKAYLDFAHAPSKVKATVAAVREKHPAAHLIACLELHTFSSLNPEFLPQYKNALKAADVKIVYYSPHTLAIKKLPDLSVALLAEFFNEPDLNIATSAQELEDLITAMKSDRSTVMLWMSSGRFDGLDLEGVTAKFLPPTP